MNAWPEARAVAGFLDAVSRRLTILAGVKAARLACLVFAVTTIVIWLAGLPVRPASLGVLASLSVGAAFALAVRRARRHTMVAAAHAVERRAPECRNLVVTAAELLSEPNRVKPEIGSLVSAHAARICAGMNGPALFPLSRPAAGLAAAAALAVVAVAFLPGRPAPALTPSARAAARTPTIAGVEVTVTPPGYAGQTETTFVDPDEVRAMAGSRIDLRIDTGAERVTIETVEGSQTIAREVSTGITGTVVVTRDGFIAIVPLDAAGLAAPTRRLMGLTVIPDLPPAVRIVEPGRDLYLATADDGIPIEIAADDDIGLSALRLTYTTVSGSGENFEFREGELPVTLTRTDARRWTASAKLALASLSLSPGDSVVYRAVVADVRPDAMPVESDTFMVQIVTPDRAIAGGFAIDDEFNRYAISQQMVILQTERLAARRASMSPEAFAEAALDIAADQRRVRAEFVFMMGSDLEAEHAHGDELDETAEAAREPDLAAGRLRNQGAADVILATRHMARAALLLGQPDTTAALVDERAALAALQRAFAKDRYILRALATQAQLDPSRRLGGSLEDAAGATRPSAMVEPPPAIATLRTALAGVAALASRSTLTEDDARRAIELSQAVLAVDPAASALRDVAMSLTEAANRITGAGDGNATVLLDRAAAGLTAAIRADSRAAPLAPAPELGRLGGAVADALRRGGS